MRSGNRSNFYCVESRLSSQFDGGAGGQRVALVHGQPIDANGNDGAGFGGDDLIDEDETPSIGGSGGVPRADPARGENDRIVCDAARGDGLDKPRLLAFQFLDAAAELIHVIAFEQAAGRFKDNPTANEHCHKEEEKEQRKVIANEMQKKLAIHTVVKLRNAGNAFSRGRIFLSARKKRS